MSRVKLGPYKITQEFWERIQQLPGENDEQRTILALAACCEVQERAKLQREAQRVKDKREAEKTVEQIGVEVLASGPIATEAIASLGAAPFPSEPKTCGDNCHHHDDGNGFTVDYPGVPLP